MREACKTAGSFRNSLHGLRIFDEQNEHIHIIRCFCFMARFSFDVCCTTHQCSRLLINHQSQDVSKFFCLFLSALCLVSDENTDNHGEVL